MEQEYENMPKRDSLFSVINVCYWRPFSWHQLSWTPTVSPQSSARLMAQRKIEIDKKYKELGFWVISVLWEQRPGVSS